MAIVLRSVKGTELSYNELDGNFIDLDGRLTNVESWGESLGRLTEAESSLTSLESRVTAAEGDATLLTARVVDVEVGLSVVIDDLSNLTGRVTAVETVAAAATDYTPGTGAVWTAPAPTTVSEALDRLSAVVATLNGGTGA